MITKTAVSAANTNVSEVSTLDYIQSLEKVSDFLYAAFPDTAFIITGKVDAGKKDIVIYWHDGVSMKDVVKALSVFSPENKAYLDNDENITPSKNGNPVKFDFTDIKVNKTFSKESVEEIKEIVVNSNLMSDEEITVVPGSEDEIGYTFSFKMKEKLTSSIKSSNGKTEAARAVDSVLSKMFNFSN